MCPSHHKRSRMRDRQHRFPDQRWSFDVPPFKCRIISKAEISSGYLFSISHRARVTPNKPTKIALCQLIPGSTPVAHKPNRSPEDERNHQRRQWCCRSTANHWSNNYSFKRIFHRLSSRIRRFADGISFGISYPSCLKSSALFPSANASASPFRAALIPR